MTGSDTAGPRWWTSVEGRPSYRGPAPVPVIPPSSACRQPPPLLTTPQCVGVREIARRLHRDPSTVSRELRRNAATRGGKLEYRASVAQWKAELVARRPKTAKM